MLFRPAFPVGTFAGIAPAVEVSVCALAFYETLKPVTKKKNLALLILGMRKKWNPLSSQFPHFALSRSCSFSLLMQPTLKAGLYQAGLEIYSLPTGSERVVRLV